MLNAAVSFRCSCSICFCKLVSKVLLEMPFHIIINLQSLHVPLKLVSFHSNSLSLLSHFPLFEEFIFILLVSSNLQTLFFKSFTSILCISSLLRKQNFSIICTSARCRCLAHLLYCRLLFKKQIAIDIFT